MHIHKYISKRRVSRSLKNYYERGVNIYEKLLRYQVIHAF